MAHPLVDTVGNIIREIVWCDENEKGWKGILGFKYGIVQAPLGPDISGPELVAAVANAGCLGFLRAPDGDDDQSLAQLRGLIRKTKEKTDQRFGVGIILSFPYDKHVKVILEEKVAVLETFGGDCPQELACLAHRHGLKVVSQIGNLDGAKKAVAAGVDAIIVQGHEAGGHLVGQEGLISLLPMVVDLVKCSGITVIAAGGMVDARGYLAAMALGAHGVSLGTRFVATTESYAHDTYKKKIVDLEKTEYTTVFGRHRWPNAPHRTLQTCFFRKELPPYETENDQPEIGNTIIHDKKVKIHLFAGTVPNKTTTGRVEEMAMYAGQSVGLIKEILPAGEFIKRHVKAAQEMILEMSLTSLFD